MNDYRSSWHSFIKAKGAIFNIKNKVYLWFLNKFVAKEDEYYGLAEPSTEWMSLHNKKFWLQPCNKGSEEDMK